MKDQFYNFIRGLQDKITKELESIDGKAKFNEDLWERSEGGGGRSRIIENGNVIEKGGVNISAVDGPLPESMQKYFNVNEVDFFACGLSLVIHPFNPMIPTVHGNWRYFEMYDKKGNIIDQWFGGGQDLTPYYIFEEDVKHFHQSCKNVCDHFHPDYYSEFKTMCDNYFFNHHRNEARGVGGLFFDDFNQLPFEESFVFVQSMANSYMKAYCPIVEKRKDSDYGARERSFQEYRRGRYVEFNLVYDRGTVFGLQSGVGRIESILMSLPPAVQWVYDWQPEPGSAEEKLYTDFLIQREWA